MTVLVKENFSSPSVVIDGLVRAGAADDPIGKEGVSAFTVAHGDARHRAPHVRADLRRDRSGGRNGRCQFRHQRHVVRRASRWPKICRWSSTFWPMCCSIPTFPEAEMEKERGEVLTDLQERANNTRRMAGLTFRELLYPADHPYHRSVQGYTETVAAITRDELINYYRSAYGAHGLIVSIVGAVKADDALRIWEDQFGAWIGAQVDRGVPPAAPRLTERREKRVDIPGKSQSDLVLGFVGPARSAPDYLDARMAQFDPGRVWSVWPLGRARARKGRHGLLFVQPTRRRPGPGRVASHRGRRSGQRR